jgi:hypothetical protein
MDKNGVRKLGAFAIAAVLIGAGQVSLAVVPVTGGGTIDFEMFIVGYLIGSVFGHAIASSAWIALGPFPIFVRAPLSLLWSAVTALAFAINVSFYSPQSSEVIYVMALCIGGIWVVAQSPFWCLRWIGGVCLRDQADAATIGAPPQYGIRQLLIFTFLVAIVFGLGRALLPLLPQLSGINRRGEAGIFIGLSVAAVLISLPLAPVIFLSRYALAATAGVLALIVLATWWELPLFNQVFKGPGGGPVFMHFVWMNVFTTGWLLAIGLTIRYAGYRLSSRGKLPFASLESKGAGAHS